MASWRAVSPKLSWKKRKKSSLQCKEREAYLQVSGTFKRGGGAVASPFFGSEGLFYYVFFCLSAKEEHLCLEVGIWWCFLFLSLGRGDFQKWFIQACKCTLISTGTALKIFFIPHNLENGILVHTVETHFNKGPGYLGCYVRYFVTSFLNKQYKTKHIDFVGTGENSVLYNAFHELNQNSSLY